MSVCVIKNLIIRTWGAWVSKPYRTRAHQYAVGNGSEDSSCFSMLRRRPYPRALEWQGNKLTPMPDRVTTPSWSFLQTESESHPLVTGMMPCDQCASSLQCVGRVAGSLLSAVAWVALPVGDARYVSNKGPTSIVTGWLFPHTSNLRVSPSPESAGW